MLAIGGCLVHNLCARKGVHVYYTDYCKEADAFVPQRRAFGIESSSPLRNDSLDITPEFKLKMNNYKKTLK